MANADVCPLQKPYGRGETRQLLPENLKFDGETSENVPASSLNRARKSVRLCAQTEEKKEKPGKKAVFSVELFSRNPDLKWRKETENMRLLFFRTAYRVIHYLDASESVRRKSK